MQNYTALMAGYLANQNEKNNMSSSNRKALKVIPHNLPDAEDATLPLPTTILPHKDTWGFIAARARNPVDARNMALSCRFLYHSTLSVLRQWKLPTLARWVVVDPTLANVDKIINAMRYDRALLFAEIDEVMDGTCHRIIKQKNLYQLAYGACDDDLVRKMEAVYIEHLGAEEAKRVLEQQRNKMLPTEEEHKQNEAVCLAKLEALLVPIIAAIGTEPFVAVPGAKIINLRQETLDAINTFKVGFASTQPGEIENGMHFRFSLMQLACDREAALAVQWNHSYHKLRLYEDVVIAALQDFAPVFVAMELSQGLIYQQGSENPESCRRSLGLREGGGNYYAVVQGASDEFAGVSGYCLDIYHGAALAGWRLWFGIEARAAAWKVYVEQKLNTCDPHKLCNGQTISTTNRHGA
jgi:hypothetical protein